MFDVEFRRIQANGINHRVAVKGSGPLILLVHGYPESWYSWRHQIDALASAGYTVAAPDVRGYGGTDKPYPVEAYTLEQLAADMAGIAKVLSPDAPAVVIGHDWGAPIAWNSALLHPQQFRAVAGLSVPYVLPGKIPEIDYYHSVYTDKGLFFYQVYFQDEGVAEAEFEEDIARSVRMSFYNLSADKPRSTTPLLKKIGARLFDDMPEPPLELPWLSKDDISYYASQFAASGYRGPINRYRNSRADHAFLTAQPDLIIHQPSLYIGGTHDIVKYLYTQKLQINDLREAMDPSLSNLQGYHILENCGHWTQQERPQEVNEILIDWVNAL